MILNLTPENFERETNNLISEGWHIENIEMIQIYKVKLTKMSGNVVYKQKSKTPILTFLSKTMIIKICKILNVEHYNLYKHELIEKLEEFSKGVVVTAYDSITKIEK